jgi:hypothetical protein
MTFVFAPADYCQHIKLLVVSFIFTAEKKRYAEALRDSLRISFSLRLKKYK